jgi:arylsulfatase A-like enzyme/tetratricopeptide (TPR) repeat protein
MISLLLFLACNGGQPAETTPVAEAKAGKPNILLFTLDTTRADMLGTYGSSMATPNIDTIARESVVFTRAYTVTPLTIPAHSSLFTGMFPPRHGVEDNGDFFLGPDAHTLAETMSDAGYQTMAAVGAEVTSHHWGFDQGFQTFFDDLKAPKENRWQVERRADAVEADALSWLDKRNPDQPFFAWIHFYDPHNPYVAPDDYRKLFPGREYMAEVAWTDHVVGQIIEHLKASGALDNTWIFLMADHGEGLGSHGEGMHAVLIYDATTHIPMIVHPPGGTKMRMVDDAVSLVDIAPTIAAIAGAKPLEGIDGTDLGPAINGTGSIAARDGVYVESLYAFRHYGWAPQRALVDKDYKLLLAPQRELYRKIDKTEMTNMADQEPAVAQSMHEKLDALMQKMVPAQGVSQSATMSSDRMNQLQALGYVTATAPTTNAPESTLPDPKTRLPFLMQVEKTRQALQEGNPKEARARAEAALKEEPNLSDLRVLYAQILMGAGDAKKALEILEPMRDSGSAQVIAALGNIHLSQGDPEQGIGELEQATQMDPYLVAAWVPYLQALFLSGDVDRFVAEAVRAGAMFPKDAPVQGMYGLALVLGGNPDQAQPVLEAALAEDPFIPFANHALGTLMKERGDTAKAESFLQEEIRLHPPAIPARRTLVEIYAGEQRYTEQLDQLAVIEKVGGPPDALTYHSKAQALFNLQRYKESKVAVDACRKVAPEYPACALLEANVLKKLGHEEEALAAYDRAIKLAQKIDPGVKGKRNDLAGSGSGSGAVAPAVAEKDDPAAEYKGEPPVAAKHDAAP